MDILHLLVQNAAISALCFLGLWLVGIALKDVSFVDSWWALGIVVLALVTHFETGDASPHGMLLLLLCTLWGLRLGFYLLWRWRKNGPDRRYQTMLGKAQSERKWGFAQASLLLVFALQAPLQFIVALPVQLGQYATDEAPLGLLAYGGLVLAVVGFLFESIGDLQLVRFKRTAANNGKVLDSGLWRYTRHPNYFGDACVWWGLFLIAVETPYGIWTLPAPLLLTFLLTRWSGVPTVEGRMRRKRPDYESYMNRTSGFIPWPPKA